MHQSVLDAFAGFSTRFEGRVAWMYLDILGLVTTAVGCLIDPVEAAVALPWKLPDGSLAAADLVRAQWHDLKSQQRLSKLHYKYAAAVTTIRLTDADIDTLVRGVALKNEVALEKAYPAWDAWPADAQLCALSMSWAVGAGFPHIFGNFTKFANAGDWLSAAACAVIKTDGNPGIVPRNAANRLCLANAAAVATNHYDPEVLYWPDAAHDDAEPAHAEAQAELDMHAAKLALLAGERVFNPDLSHDAESQAAYADEPTIPDNAAPTEPSPPPDAIT